MSLLSQNAKLLSKNYRNSVFINITETTRDAGKCFNHA